MINNERAGELYALVDEEGYAADEGTTYTGQWALVETAVTGA